MGGNLPFIPGVYQPNSTIAELILKAGQERARSQERLGQTISDSLLNIGNAAQQGFAQRQRTQNEQKIQGAVSRGIASPDSFETALQALPPEIRTQARKEYSDASDAAARIAERHAKTAQEKVLTQAAQRKFEQDNINDLGTIADRAMRHATDDDGGLSGLLGAQHAMKANGVPHAENFDGPLQDLVANWQKAVASNDPAQIKAAADQNRAAAKAVFDPIMMRVSPEHMKLLATEQPAGVSLAEGARLVNPRTGAEMAQGAPKPKTLDQQIAEAAPDSPELAAALKKKGQEAAAGRDPNAGPGPALSAAGLEMAAMNYRKTGTLPALGMGDKQTRKLIIDRAANMTPADVARIEAGPIPDLASAKADYAATSGALKKLTTQQASINAFENTALKNIDTFLATASKVVDTGSPFANSLARHVSGKMLGSPDQAAYDAARQVAINEATKVLSGASMGGQAMSDAARREVGDLAPANMTLKQLVAVVNILKSDMANRKQATADEIASLKGGMAGRPAAVAAPSATAVPAATGGNLDAFLAKFGSQ